MGNGRYCYPLTVTDGFSRFLLGCHGLSSTAVEGAKPVFQSLFHEYGLPQFIRPTLPALGLVGAPGRDAAADRTPAIRSRTGAMSACIAP